MQHERYDAVYPPTSKEGCGGRRRLSHACLLSLVMLSAQAPRQASAFSLQAVGVRSARGLRSTAMSCARHASSAAAVFEASNVAADGALHSRQSVLRLAAGLALSLAPASPPAVRAAGDEDAERILAGYETLVDLIDNWPKYAGTGEEANGDNVRRQIGTVGNKSPLFGIRKVMLRKQVDLDLFEAVDNGLTAVDADAYSAIFADSSTSPKRGYQYMKDALKDAKKLKAAYEEVLEFLGLSPGE